MPSHSLTTHITLTLASLLLTSCDGCPDTLPELDDATRDYTGELPVFPGAQGFGTTTKAGREGKILRVTTLASDGPGSLRDALAQSGPRTIIFEISGVITLRENLIITDPFVTVAGQTAPAPGITLSGAGLSIQTHDVLVQHLHVRPGGDKDGVDFEKRDAIEILGQPDGSSDVYNIVIDHCSMSWGVDETVSTWYPGVRDVTISNSIIAETLDDAGHPEGPHSKGLLIGDHTRRASIIGNLLLHHDDRNPHMKGDTSSLIANNLVYNYGRWPLTVFDNKIAKSGPSLVSAIGNVFIAGPDSPPEHSTVFIGRSTKADTIIYLEDNQARDFVEGDPCSIMDTEKEEDDDVTCRTQDPPVMVSPLMLLPANEVRAFVLANAGAFPLARHPIDARYIEDVNQGTGRIIDSVSEVGGPPSYPPVERPLVTPERPDEDDDGDGYTNLEEWLHTFPRDL